MIFHGFTKAYKQLTDAGHECVDVYVPVCELKDQRSHLFQQRISCLAIGLSGFRHTCLLLLIATLKTTCKPIQLVTILSCKCMHV